jgi:hypothetical protein
MNAAIASRSVPSIEHGNAGRHGAEGRRVVSYAGLALSLLLLSAAACPGEHARHGAGDPVHPAATARA